MKKLVLLFAVVFTFVACGKKATEEKAESEDSIVIVDTIESQIDTTNVIDTATSFE
ncbi:MAG: hypothetical protein KBG25_04680 [Paludibacteraceae bacterium]|nr:hypothetical protein [Paludibacteraceae bacterium]